MPFRQVTRARNVNTSVVVGRAGKWRSRPVAAKRDKTSTKCVGFGRQAEYKPWHTFLTWGNVANFSPLLGRCRKTYALRTKNFATGPRKVRQRRRTSLSERQNPFGATRRAPQTSPACSKVTLGVSSLLGTICSHVLGIDAMGAPRGLPGRRRNMDICKPSDLMTPEELGSIIGWHPESGGASGAGVAGPATIKGLHRRVPPVVFRRDARPYRLIP